MKIIAFFTLLLLSPVLYGQTEKETIIELKLFLPAHIKNGPTVNEKLMIYFTVSPEDSMMKISKNTTAKKVKENIYFFKLPETKLWQIGFSIGNYSYSMMCINNTDGQAAENYDFNILLENKKVDFTKIRFLPPCVYEDKE